MKEVTMDTNKEKFAFLAWMRAIKPAAWMGKVPPLDVEGANPRE